MAAIGVELKPMVDLNGNITNVNFLENMFKPIWMGSLVDLDGFIKKLVVDAFDNNTKLISSYNISDNRIFEIRSLISNDLNGYVNEIINTNNLIELNALLGVVMQEMNNKYVNGELANYPFKDRAIFDAFDNNASMLTGNRARVTTNDFQKISIDTNTLSDEEREELVGIINNKIKLQSMFSAIKTNGNNIEIIYSTQGIKEYKGRFGKAKKDSLTMETKYIESNDVNHRSIKVFEILANEFKTLLINKKDVNRNVVKTLSSNEVLGLENEFVQKELEKAAKIDEQIKGVNKEELNELRGSNKPSFNVNTRPDPENIKEVIKEEMKEKVSSLDITKVINIKETNLDDIQNSIVELEMNALKEKLNTAKSLANEVSMKFLGYLEKGMSINEANKLLLEFTRGNEYAVKMGMALTTKSLSELKSINESLVEENNNYSNQLIKATESIELAANKIIELNETNETQKNSYEKIIGENLEKMNEMVNEYNELVEDSNKLSDDLNEANKTIELRDNTIKFKDAEMIALSSEFVKQTQIKDKEIAMLKEQLESKNSIINELNTKVTAQEDKLTSNANEIKDLNINVENLNKTIELRDNELETKVDEVNQLTTKVNTLNETIRIDKINLSKFESNISDLNTKINELNQLVNDSKTTIETKEKEIEKEKELVLSKNTEIVKLKNTITEKERELIDVNNRLENELKKSFNKPQLDKVEEKTQPKIEFVKESSLIDDQPKVESKSKNTYSDMIKEQKDIFGFDNEEKPKENPKKHNQNNVKE